MVILRLVLYLYLKLNFEEFGTIFTYFCYFLLLIVYKIFRDDFLKYSQEDTLKFILDFSSMGDSCTDVDILMYTMEQFSRSMNAPLVQRIIFLSLMLASCVMCTIALVALYVEHRSKPYTAVPVYLLASLLTTGQFSISRSTASLQIEKFHRGWTSIFRSYGSMHPSWIKRVQSMMLG